jgi:hypothetical protein
MNEQTAAQLNQKAQEITNAQIAADKFANEKLQAARQALLTQTQQIASQPNGSSGGNAGKVLSDSQLVQEAMQSYDNGQQFSLDEANKAQNPEVRDDLTTLANVQKFQSNLDKDEQQTSNALAQVVSMAATALQRNSNIQSMPTGDSNAATSQNFGGNRSPASASGPETANLAGDPSGPSGTTISDKTATESANAQQIKQLVDALSKLKGPRSTALRERLMAQLANLRKADAKKGDAAAGGDSAEAFSGKLSREKLEASKEDGTSEPSGGAAQVVSSALELSKAPPPFTLSGPDTDAAVKKLLGGEGTDGSIADRDSPSLFERVHKSISSCLRRECVVGKDGQQKLRETNAGRKFRVAAH